MTGFVATDYTRNLTIVSFRGSASIRSWLSDIILVRVPVDICSDCTAHRGFWTSWVDARDRVLQAIRAAVARNPGFRVAVTGHSMGGSIASLAAAELRNNGYNVALVILCMDSPTVGCANMLLVHVRRSPFWKRCPQHVYHQSSWWQLSRHALQRPSPTCATYVGRLCPC